MAEKKQSTDVPSSVAFEYIKSNYFRVIHVDGVFGGITPRGHIHMSVWSQRGATPDRVTHEVKPNGEVGRETARQGSDAIIRELEAGLVLDVNLARSVVKWLQDKIQRAEEQETDVNEKEERPE